MELLFTLFGDRIESEAVGESVATIGRSVVGTGVAVVGSNVAVVGLSVSGVVGASVSE